MDTAYGNNVIRVLSVNTPITITGETSGEFVQATTPGDSGWVFAAYIALGTPPTNGGGTPLPQGSATGTVTTALNLRELASTDSRVIVVMPAGQTLTITGAAVNGFLLVIYGTLGGWAASEYVQSGDGGNPGGSSYRTTAALNLRAQPNVNSALLLVVPAGATVSGIGQGSAGYLGITHHGTPGFVLGAYLVGARADGCSSSTCRRECPGGQRPSSGRRRACRARSGTCSGVVDRRVRSLNAGEQVPGNPGDLLP